MMKFIYMCTAIAKAELKARETQRKIDLHRARQLELEQRRILHEAKIARENNAVVLQDIEIEKKKLDLELLEKQVHPPRWQDEPIDHDESTPRF